MWQLPKSYPHGKKDPADRRAEINSVVGETVGGLYEAFQYGDSHRFAELMATLNRSGTNAPQEILQRTAQRLLDAHVLNHDSYQQFMAFAERARIHAPSTEMGMQHTP